MTDDAPAEAVETATAPPRPEGCAAARDVKNALMTCGRCGLAWPIDEKGPDCAPIKFADVVDRLRLDADAAEASMIAVLSAGNIGLPTDGGRAARRRWCELEMARRLMNFFTTDKVCLERWKTEGRKNG